MGRQVKFISLSWLQLYFGLVGVQRDFSDNFCEAMPMYVMNDDG